MIFIRNCKRVIASVILACATYFASASVSNARDIAINFPGWQILSGKDAMDDHEYFNVVTSTKSAGDLFETSAECARNKGGVSVEFTVVLTSKRVPELGFHYIQKDSGPEGWVDVRGDLPDIVRKTYSVKYYNQATINFADEGWFRQSLKEENPLVQAYLGMGVSLWGAMGAGDLVSQTYREAYAGPPDLLLANKSLRLRLAANDGVDRTLILNLADPQFRRFLNLCGIE